MFLGFRGSIQNLKRDGLRGEQVEGGVLAGHVLHMTPLSSYIATSVANSIWRRSSAAVYLDRRGRVRRFARASCRCLRFPLQVQIFGF